MREEIYNEYNKYFKHFTSSNPNSNIILAVWLTFSQILAPETYLSKKRSGDVYVRLN